MFSSCEKEEVAFNVLSNDAQQMRKAYTNKGYTEVIVDSIPVEVEIEEHH